MYHGVLLGIRVVIFNVDEARSLFKNGFYGKPFGIKKPRDAEFDAPLELSLLEAVYLMENNALSVVGSNGASISLEDLRKIASENIPRFEMLYKVYRDLRSTGLVVRSGLKFGSDFAVYRYGPGIDHAPYLIHVYGENSALDPVEIVRAGRLSHSVRKTFTVAAVGGNPKPRYIMFKWFKP